MNKKAKDIAEGLVLMIHKGGPKKKSKDSECTCKNCPMHGNDAKEEQDEE